MTDMEDEKPYKRRISSEEVKKGYVFVLKDKLDYFPSTGKPFELRTDAKSKEARVETYRCTCRGPELPHDHYFIRWEGLKFGDKVTIEKEEGESPKYSLTIGR